MNYSFELVDETPSEDCKIGVIHLNYIEGYVFCSGIDHVPEGYR